MKKSILLIASLLFSCNAFAAGVLTIKNDNSNKDISLRFIPYGPFLDEKNHSFIRTISAYRTLKLELNSGGAASSYSVKGENYTFIGLECDNLSFNKDYIITFSHTKYETVCKAKEIPRTHS